MSKHATPSSPAINTVRAVDVSSIAPAAAVLQEGTGTETGCPPSDLWTRNFERPSEISHFESLSDPGKCSGKSLCTEQEGLLLIDSKPLATADRFEIISLEHTLVTLSHGRAPSSTRPPYESDLKVNREGVLESVVGMLESPSDRYILAELISLEALIHSTSCEDIVEHIVEDVARTSKAFQAILDRV